MTDPRGFLQIQRRVTPYRPVEERVRDYAFVAPEAELGDVREQARRCMGCGVPFCHTGCPLGNLIPQWNDLVDRDHLRAAIDRLHATLALGASIGRRFIRAKWKSGGCAPSPDSGLQAAGSTSGRG